MLVVSQRAQGSVHLMWQPSTETQSKHISHSILKKILIDIRSLSHTLITRVWRQGWEQVNGSDWASSLREGKDKAINSTDSSLLGGGKKLTRCKLMSVHYIYMKRAWWKDNTNDSYDQFFHLRSYSNIQLSLCLFGMRGSWCSQWHKNGRWTSKSLPVLLYALWNFVYFPHNFK